MTGKQLCPWQYGPPPSPTWTSPPCTSCSLTPTSQESHPYQHFADRPIIDRDLAPLYDLSPAAYQRIVNDLVNLVGAVHGYGQQRCGQSLAQAVASNASTVLMGYDEDVTAQGQAIHPAETADSQSTPHTGSANNHEHSPYHTERYAGCRKIVVGEANLA